MKLIFRWIILSLFFVSLFAVIVSSKEGRTQDKIVFVRDGNIWVINGDGSVENMLTSTGKYANPQWSPDGKKIVYERIKRMDFRDDNELWIKDLSGGKEYKFADGFSSTVWTTTGEIFFGKNDKSSDYGVSIFKKNVANNKEQKVGDGKANGDSFFGVRMVSEKDKLVGFFVSGGRGSCLWLADFDGKDVERPGKPQNISGPSESFEDYNETKSYLLTSIVSLAGYPVSKGLWVIDLNKQESIYISSYGSESVLLHGKWSSDGKTLIAVTDKHNLEKLSDFDESGSPGAEMLCPNKHVILTTSGDIDDIISVTNNKIFYTRTSGKDYYLWGIVTDGSSPKRLAKVDTSWVNKNIDVWYQGK